MTPPTYPATAAAIVARLRTDAGLDRPELSEAIGRPWWYVREVEVGHYHVSPDLIDRLTAALSLSDADRTRLQRAASQERRAREWAKYERRAERKRGNAPPLHRAAPTKDPTPEAVPLVRERPVPPPVPALPVPEVYAGERVITGGLLRQKLAARCLPSWEAAMWADRAQRAGREAP